MFRFIGVLISPLSLGRKEGIHTVRDLDKLVVKLALRFKIPGGNGELESARDDVGAIQITKAREQQDNEHNGRQRGFHDGRVSGTGYVSGF